ncbi:MAG: SufE family protein [Rikenellaceae bacterium]
MKDQIQDEIIEEFEMFEEWLDKYNYLIELSGDMPPFDEKCRTPEHLIEGCQSRVWVAAEMRDGAIFYSADSDAIITKGIIALLMKVMNGRTPAEVRDMELYFIDAIGLSENLSPTRSNGLLSMIKQMRLYAVAFAAKCEASK